MTTNASNPADLQQAARDHLWLHFTRMGGYRTADVPDHRQRRRLLPRGLERQALPGRARRALLVNLGYGFGEEIGQAALEQMRELPFYTNWSYAHPRAIELADELASLAPGDLNRVFFVSGGSEAVESAWKLARQYYLAAAASGSRGETRHDERVGTPPPRKYKAIARQIAYHGTTMGALSINGIPALRSPSSRSCPRCGTSRTRTATTGPPEETEAEFTGCCSRTSRRRSSPWGRRRSASSHGAGAERGRRLHPAGRLLARRARALRPLRHPPLGRRGDHRLRPRRPLVRLGALRHPAGHRLLRQGPLVLVRGDRRRARDRQGDGAVPRGHARCTRTGSPSAAIPSCPRSR